MLARALVGVRVESLARPGVLYERNANSLVMPASNLKLFTLAASAERLGWNFTFETRLEAAGTIADGALRGDLVVVGGGDPSIASQDFGAAPMFGEWADALKQAGIRRVDGRLIGDDHVFDQAKLGAGWAWDYLADGYAAPVGGLSYNENVAVVRIWPGEAPGEPVRVEVSPPGHQLDSHQRAQDRRREIDGVDRPRAAAGQRAPDDLGHRAGRRQAGHAHGRDRQPDAVLRRGPAPRARESRHPRHGRRLGSG